MLVLHAAIFAASCANEPTTRPPMNDLFLNRADDLRRQPNGETKLQALSIRCLIDTALLILLWRPRVLTGQAVPNLFRKRNSRDILARHSVNLHHMTFVSGKGQFASKGKERGPFHLPRRAFLLTTRPCGSFGQVRWPHNRNIPCGAEHSAL